MSTLLSVRIEKKTKEAAQKALSDIGLDLSSGIKVFLHQVIADQGLPFTPSKRKVSGAQLDKEFVKVLKSKKYSSTKNALTDLN